MYMDIEFQKFRRGIFRFGKTMMIVKHRFSCMLTRTVQQGRAALIQRFLYVSHCWCVALK